MYCFYKEIAVPELVGEAMSPSLQGVLYGVSSFKLFMKCMVSFVSNEININSLFHTIWNLQQLTAQSVFYSQQFLNDLSFVLGNSIDDNV
jgi:hypothetical protein